ncbi:hypothetical protein TRFO_34442 [Tritrichomonas foetus]|uniref:Auto-transporter adhesin head GIN domain-containing protein n=1 Tax=Tritrichomonas foetus TaxID=1144522 RepID=A0A1J4JNR7_9EUKA|nr:hypothetical protein TRFO_34442 [Tritrichomonas foetus]|eukprot:OHS99165.1 hypothetical protein TRFO_34442 [Tritrichomonas foetus]
MFFFFVCGIYCGITINIDLPVQYYGDITVVFDNNQKYIKNYQKISNSDKYTFSKSWSNGTLQMTISIDGYCNNYIIANKKLTAENQTVNINIESLRNTRCELTRSSVRIKNQMTNMTLFTESVEIPPNTLVTVSTYALSITILGSNQFCSLSYINTVLALGIHVYTYTDEHIPKMCIPNTVLIKNNMTSTTLLIEKTEIPPGIEQEISFGYFSTDVFIKNEKCQKREIFHLTNENQIKIYNDEDIPNICRNLTEDENMTVLPEQTEETQKFLNELEKLQELPREDLKLDQASSNMVRLCGGNYIGSTSFNTITFSATSFSILTLSTTSALTLILRGPIFAKVYSPSSLIVIVECDIDNNIMPAVAVNGNNAQVNVYTIGNMNSTEKYINALGVMNSCNITLISTFQYSLNEIDSVASIAGFQDVQVIHAFDIESCYLLEVDGNISFDFTPDPNTNTHKHTSSNEAITEGTQKLKDKIQEIQRKSIEDIKLTNQGSSVLDISGRHISGTSDKISLTLKASELAIINLSLKQGKITLEGPIIAYITHNNSTIELVCDASEKIMPIAFVSGKETTLKVTIKGKAQEPFLAAIGFINGSASVVDSDSLKNRAFKPNEIGIYAGFSEVVFSEIGEQFFIVEIQTKNNNLVMIIGIVAAVIVVIIIIIAVLIYMKKRKKDNSSDE